MKKLVSVLLILMLLCGCAWAAESGTKDMLKTIYWMYSMNNDLDDKYLDTALMYFLMYQEENLDRALGMYGIMGEDAYRMMYDGWIEIIRNICEKKLAYSNGEMTKEAYTKYLFTLIKVAVE